MDLAKLRAEYAAKVAEARAIGDKWKADPGKMPPEDRTAIEQALGKSDELKAQLDLGLRINAGESFMNDPANTPVAAAGWRTAAPDEGMPAVDQKAWRNLEVKTPFGSQMVRYNVALAVQKKGYGDAFEAYCRKGMGDMGPQDRKTLNEATDTAGGFLVPEDFHIELIKKLATMAVVRNLARKITTSRDVATWPRINYGTDDNYTSGVRLTWTGQAPATSTVHRVTDPVFGKITIPVHTAMASMPIVNSMLEDSAFDVMGIANELIGEAYALGEDNVFINGTGVAQPLGILAEVDTNGPASVKSGTSSVLTTTGDAWTGLRINNIFYALPAQYRGRAAWLYNSTTAALVDNLVDTNKRPLVQDLYGGLTNGPISQIKGRPVYVDEFVPTPAASSNSVIWGDLSGYIIVDRVGLSIQRLSEIYAETDITLLLARKRVGGYLAEAYRVKVLQLGA